MNIFQKVSLKDYSTMRLGGTAKYLTEVNTTDELIEIIKWARLEKLSMLMIGGGSNTFWSDKGYDGLVIVNKILGFETFADDKESIYVTVGAGEEWDFVVKRVVDMGYSGIETLSLIPGSTGATPIQNVGAYGSEIADTLVSVEAYDTKTRELVTIKADECDFSYRSSRFKRQDKNRFFITAITLRVTTKRKEAPYYAAIQKYFDEHKAEKITPRVIREAVISIRESKLPDPKVVPNNGSFFANPVIDEQLFKKIISEYPEVVYWEVDNKKFKLAAGWLIEEAGYKGINDLETGISTWPKQALVFVNTNAKKTSDLIKFRNKVISTVNKKFGVTLQQEPELLP